MNIGYEISSRRKALGMTQESLATALGVTNQAVSKWEMNVNCPDIQLLPALADILKVSIDELFGRRAEVKDQAPDSLPWKDDGQLRAVVYIGQTLKYQKNLDEATKNRVSEFTMVYEGEALNVASVFSIKCSGDIHGHAAAGRDVFCCDVEGNASAGGTMKCGDIEGNAAAGGDLTCGGIGGSAVARNIFRK